MGTLKIKWMSGRNLMLTAVITLLFFSFVGLKGSPWFEKISEEMPDECLTISAENLKFMESPEGLEILNEAECVYYDQDVYVPDFNFSYVVIYDTPPSKEDINNWKGGLSEVQLLFYRESMGKIKISTDLFFVDKKFLGMDYLNYSQMSFHEWYDILNQSLQLDSYEIVGFSPMRDISWCEDGPSFGFRYGEKVVFCLEEHPVKESGDFEFPTLLTIHKIMHGWGYNHLYEKNKYGFVSFNLGIPFKKFNYENNIYFNKFFLEHLGVYESEIENFENCAYEEKLWVDTDRYWSFDAYGTYCSDIDSDGLPDNEDDYYLTPFGSEGPDSDSDGISESLDLCPNNVVNTNFSDTMISFSNYAALFEKNAGIQVNFSFPEGELVKILKYNGNTSGEKFNSFENETALKGSVFFLERSQPLVKLEIFYRVGEDEYYRRFYLTNQKRIFESLEYGSDLDWYNFHRLGCDPFSSGLPDVPDNYDWDGDGVPDKEDGLPTVPGRCSASEFLQGLSDSDGDGLCDPIHFPILKNYIGMDFCPFLKGTRENRGCPDLDGDGLWWYDDFFPLTSFYIYNPYVIDVLIR